MVTYSPAGKSYVHVVEIPRNAIDKIDVEVCAQPKETLTSFYNRKEKKPDVLVNGGLFGMSGGIPCFGLIDEYKKLANDGARVWGIGVKNNANIAYGKIDAGWRDWISGYPVLIENYKKTTITDALELDYKARRTIWGFDNKCVYIVTADSPGLNFSEMQTLMHDLGCAAAINLDGGGSTRCMVKGETITNGLENRAVDNVLCVYLKAESKTNTTTTAQGVSGTLDIKQNLTNTNFTSVGRGASAIKYIVMHYTANNADTAYNNTDYFKNTYRGASSHYFIDENSIWQCVLDKDVSWHCGGGKQSSNGGSFFGQCTNFNSIGVEMCSDMQNGKYVITEPTVKNAVDLVKTLMKKYNIPASRVIRHYDVVGKKCPEPWVREESLWADFQKRIGGTVATTTKKSLNFKSGDIVRFTGTKQYTYASATAGVSAKPTRAKITAISATAKHPYHCRAVNENGAFVSGVYGWVDADDVEDDSFKAYLALITADELMVRAGAGTNYKVNTTIKEGGIFTIVEEKDGWGLLKSKAGWISLKYTKFLRYV